MHGDRGVCRAILAGHRHFAPIHQPVYHAFIGGVNDLDCRQSHVEYRRHDQPHPASGVAVAVHQLWRFIAGCIDGGGWVIIIHSTAEYHPSKQPNRTEKPRCKL